MNESVLVPILVLISGLLLYFKFRPNSDVLKDNVETKEKLLTIDKDIAKLDTSLKTEEIKREELKKDHEESKKDVSTDSLLDFFTKRNK